ncbi:hypothetical protein GCK72_023862 [Caenorhabditis remanei]|uniref:Uncharacterized protein n=1 Tax=Caenorhabditis remanei TaxID=31234 RepID=A0A6A5FXL2_CAERE|nr:hypothetical protein GCK72_023862 [Caenorhabditis remanei]KAF1747400.1 hypothetical protein GCK72_023862 [Caenorhabditis remanei]
MSRENQGENAGNVHEDGEQPVGGREVEANEPEDRRAVPGIRGDQVEAYLARLNNVPQQPQLPLRREELNHLPPGRFVRQDDDVSLENALFNHHFQNVEVVYGPGPLVRFQPRIVEARMNPQVFEDFEDPVIADPQRFQDIEDILREAIRNEEEDDNSSGIGTDTEDDEDMENVEEDDHARRQNPR